MNKTTSPDTNSTAYEPPRVRVVGNVHQLVAGLASQNTGIEDASCTEIEAGTWKESAC